jgi:hypothetical protein
MFFLEIRLEKLPAQIEGNLEPLDCGVADDRVLGQGEGFVEPGDRFLEIRSQRLSFSHSGVRCFATWRNFLDMRAKSTAFIV